MVSRGCLIFLALFIGAISVGPADALTVKALVGQDQVALGESLELQLRLDSSPDAEPDLTPLHRDWEVLGHSQRSQRLYNNGKISSSIVYTLLLMPRSTGQLKIPEICFATDCSSPLDIEVTTRSSLALPAEEQIRLETRISSPQVVTQGQVLLKVRLLIRAGLPEGQLSEPQPTGVETLVRKLSTDVRKYEKDASGQLYQVIERDYALFPQESGQMQIPPLQFDGVIQGGATRFDPFARQGMRIRRTAEPLEVKVTPLPHDLGRRPWIPATNVMLEDDWQQNPPEMVVGEPVTRTLRLSAVGVQAAQLPELLPAVPDEFKSYPDQASREDQLVRDGIKGTLEQKIALVPTRAGRYRLPEISLDWWYATTGQWKTVTLAAIDVDVAPAAGSLTQDAPKALEPAKGNADTRSPATEVPPQEQVAPDDSKPEPAGSNNSFWIWLSLALGLCLLLTLSLLFIQHRRFHNSVKTAPASDLPEKESSARRMVVQMARCHDPQATRQALSAWSRILWPEAREKAYEQLCESADSTLKKELEQLDLCLYGRADHVWNGDGLVTCLKGWRPEASIRKGSGLPELYPQG